MENFQKLSIPLPKNRLAAPKFLPFPNSHPSEIIALSSPNPSTEPSVSLRLSPQHTLSALSALINWRGSRECAQLQTSYDRTIRLTFCASYHLSVIITCLPIGIFKEEELRESEHFFWKVSGDFWRNSVVIRVIKNGEMGGVFFWRQLWFLGNFWFFFF